MATKGVLPTSINRKTLFVGIFLTSLSGLVLEISITRIFSAAIWYHFAFVAVSVALVGLGASGLLVQYRVKTIKGNWDRDLTVFSALAITIFVPLALFAMHAFTSQTVYTTLFMFLFAIPFFFIGTIISTAFNAFASVAGQLYSADLIGASIGALGVALLLSFLGGEGSVLLVGLISAINATIFSRISKDSRKTFVTLIFVALAIFLVFLNYSSQAFSIPTHLSSEKDLPIYLREHPEGRIVKTEWNSFSRIDVVEGGGGDEGLVAKIFIDGGAGTNVITWDGALQSRGELSTWMQYLPFTMMEDPKTLVIGSGGGRDVVAALVSGSTDVTSVEINPIIFETVKSYGQRAGNVYSHENVRSYNDEGRSFITRSSEEYDIIYLPFVDTWASVSSGGLSVSENFLYTIEGFQQYYDHLTDRGKIVAVRWLIDSPRFVSTFTTLLEKNGIPQHEIDRHLVIVTQQPSMRDPSVTMVVFSKAPFTEQEIQFLSHSFSTHGYKPILIPDLVVEEPYRAFLSGEIQLQQFYNLFDTKANPVTDDSPYFLSYEKPLPDVIIKLLYFSLIIAAYFLIFPIVLIRKSDSQYSKKQPSTASIAGYFAALGMGFILIEIALMQKLILLLGNPTTTLAILLFTLLLSSGCGSLLSPRLMRSGTRNLIFVVAGISTIGALYSFLLSPAIYSIIAAPFAAKAASAIGILAPIGFLMGMPLPTGMSFLKMHRPFYIPWMWAVNGAFSVLGAVVAVILGILYGATTAIALGIVVYLVSLVMSFSWNRLRLKDLERSAKKG